MKIPVIIDCDPGIDDILALALAFSSDKLDVRAVTVVGGNQTLDKTLNNALTFLSYAGVDVEVAKGASKPLMRELVTAPEVHGDSGLAGTVLPKPVLEPSKNNAVEVILKILTESSEKVTLIPTGPLTNIASFILAYPEAKDKIEKISLMGGACFGGNQSPVAEYNIFVDPEAASIVFNSGIPIVMNGLDVTCKAILYPDEIKKIRNIGKKISGVIADFLDFYFEFHKTIGVEGVYMHDPCAVAYVMDPTLFSTKACHVDIETKGEFTTGCTVVDYNDLLKKGKNAEVAFGIERERFVKMLIEAIAHYE